MLKYTHGKLLILQGQDCIYPDGCILSTYRRNMAHQRATFTSDISDADT